MSSMTTWTHEFSTGDRVTTVWREPVCGIVRDMQFRDGTVGWFVVWEDGYYDWCPEKSLKLVGD